MEKRMRRRQALWKFPLLWLPLQPIYRQDQKKTFLLFFAKKVSRQRERRHIQGISHSSKKSFFAIFYVMCISQYFVSFILLFMHLYLIHPSISPCACSPSLTSVPRSQHIGKQDRKQETSFTATAVMLFPFTSPNIFCNWWLRIVHSLWRTSSSSLSTTI